MIYIKYLKKYGKTLLSNILELLILIFLLTLLYYFNIINEKTYQILKLIVLLISIFINSFILGSKSNIKGYLEGIKYGVILITIILIITLITYKLQYKLLIYYPLILITSTLGSMIGKAKKNKS
ncbi:MAG: TIGR04086 family membrane protein [Bacilli bacterium]|nr:TIGR04086 family membrane protein [Bacilli bacterium]